MDIDSEQSFNITDIPIMSKVDKILSKIFGKKYIIKEDQHGLICYIWKGKIYIHSEFEEG